MQLQNRNSSLNRQSTLLSRNEESPLDIKDLNFGRQRGLTSSVIVTGAAKIDESQRLSPTQVSSVLPLSATDLDRFCLPHDRTNETSKGLTLNSLQRETIGEKLQ